MLAAAAGGSCHCPATYADAQLLAFGSACSVCTWHKLVGVVQVHMVAGVSLTRVTSVCTCVCK